MLEREGAVLEAARDLTRILRDRGIRGAIVGGVAVGLHGHVRATVDVDVYVQGGPELLAAALRKEGYTFDARRREFSRGPVPVHLVTDEQTGGPPRRIAERDGILTVGLADLIQMKLYSGTRFVLRAQDLADVIALIRAHRLTGTFAAKLDPSLRSEFKKLARAVASETRPR